MMRYAVIMAGGKGERFWPESREDHPKQMLSLFSPQTLIEQTVMRVRDLVPFEHILILTNCSYVASLQKLLPQIPAENIIGEPARRDTAPCIALAAGIIKAADPEAFMMVFPSDSMIVNQAVFTEDLILAEQNAEGALLTIGIPPTFPSPDYGYIETVSGEKITPVRRFVEKPDVKTAETMLANGNFCWNAGIFLWKISLLQRELEKYAPSLAAFMERTSRMRASANWKTFLEEEFPRQEKISVDYALMEKSSCIRMVRAGFDWDDVGSWSALRKHLSPDESGNIASGHTELLSCRDSIVFNRDADHLVAAIDMENTVIVHSGNATLIVPEKSLPKMKKLLEQIRQNHSGGQYL